jgi:glutamate dehydrogenase (NAD(P)+)
VETVPGLADMPMLANSPVYMQAYNQLWQATDLLNLDRDIVHRLSIPKRSLIVNIPIRMTNGATRVFVGYRVQHSLTSGASKGGLRYAKSVDLGEVAALAMWMSWKCGIMNLPYSGAKGGVCCDPSSMTTEELERLTRRFTEEVLSIIGPRVDVMAPDMGTTPQMMAWIMDTYSMKVGYAAPEIVTGKPIELGGCVGRREATGRGIVFCIQEAMDEMKIKMSESTAVVQGFGNVGSISALELALRGAKVIAVSDTSGGLYNPRGIDIKALMDYSATSPRGLIAGFPGAEAYPSDKILTTPCTVLVPAAMERVITPEIARDLKCRIIAEGANGPTTVEADAIINERGDIHVIPDILCNSGGVTVSYFEWVQDLQQYFWTEEEVNNRLQRLMLQAYHRVRAEATKHKIPMRMAALGLGIKKVVEEKKLRGLFP